MYLPIWKMKSPRRNWASTEPGEEGRRLSIAVDMTQNDRIGGDLSKSSAAAVTQRFRSEDRLHRMFASLLMLTPLFRINRSKSALEASCPYNGPAEEAIRGSCMTLS